MVCKKLHTAGCGGMGSLEFAQVCELCNGSAIANTLVQLRTRTFSPGRGGRSYGLFRSVNSGKVNRQPSMGCLYLLWWRVRDRTRLISSLDSLFSIFAHTRRGNSRLEDERRGWKALRFVP